MEGNIVEYRILGKTGLKVSRVGLGGIPIQRIDAAGTKVLKFEGEMLEQFVKGAYDAAWAEVEAVDAEVAKEMRSYTSN